VVAREAKAGQLAVGFGAPFLGEEGTELEAGLSPSVGLLLPDSSIFLGATFLGEEGAEPAN
jgi:hypothetical protein